MMLTELCSELEVHLDIILNVKIWPFDVSGEEVLSMKLRHALVCQK